MPEVDTSSYPRPQPPQNPLDQIMKVGQAADTIGNLEVGKGLQQAIQPDGSIDRNTLAQILKGSVAGSMKAPEALTSIERLRQQGHISDMAGVDSTLKQLSFVGQTVGDLAAKGAVSKEELTNGAGKIINHVVNNLGMSPSSIIPHVAQTLSQLNGNPNVTPQQRAAALKQLQFQTIQTRDQIDLDRQRGEWVDNGQRHVYTPVGTARNPAVGGYVQNEIAPNEKQPDSKGQPQFRGTQDPSTGSDYHPPAGQPDITKRITGYQGMPSAPTSNGQPVKLAQPGDGTAYGQPHGGAAGNAPGFETATDVNAKNSAGMLADLNTANNESQATKAIIGNLEKESRNFTSGPLADYKRIGKSFAIANLPIPSSLKKEGAIFDPSSVADQESFNKNIYNLVQSQFKALGGTGTDSKLESASHTSPSELMSQVGVKNILSLLKGNQDAIQAKAKAANDWVKAHGPQSMPEFNQEWNNIYDPRVFQFKYMDKAQRQEYFNKIDNPDERKELKRRVEYALDNKLVKY